MVSDPRNTETVDVSLPTANLYARLPEHRQMYLELCLQLGLRLSPLQLPKQPCLGKHIAAGKTTTVRYNQRTEHHYCLVSSPPLEEDRGHLRLDNAQPLT